MDGILDQVLVAAKDVKAKDLSGIVDEMEPIVMEIIEADPILSKPENLELIKEKKPILITLIKVMGPNLLKNGLSSVNVDDVMLSLK